MERQAQEAANAADDQNPTHNHSQHHRPQRSSSTTPTAATTPKSPTSPLPPSECNGAKPRLQRGSSHKLSRKRARSFGPGQKKRTLFKRAGSVDTPSHEDEGKKAGLATAKSDSLAVTCPSAFSLAPAPLGVGSRRGNGEDVMTLKVPPFNVPHPSTALSPPAASTAAAASAREGGEKPGDKPSKSMPARDTLTGEGGRETQAKGRGHGGRASDKPVSKGPKKESGVSPKPATGKKSRDKAALNLSSSGANEAPRGSKIVDGPALPSDGTAEEPGHLVQPLHLLDCSQRPVFQQSVPPHALSLHGNKADSDLTDGQGATAMQAATSGKRAAASRHLDSPDAVDALKDVEGGRVLSPSDAASLHSLKLDGLVGATGVSGAAKEDEEEGEELQDERRERLRDEVILGESAPLTMSALPKNVLNALRQELPSPDELDEDIVLLTTGSATAPMTIVTPPALETPTPRRVKRGSAGSCSQASTCSGGRPHTKKGVQGGKLKSPTPPLSWVMHSPLARIESFHSDDFELCNSSDGEHGPAVTPVSPLSVSTPTTVPCFTYRPHMAGKSPARAKKGRKEAERCSCEKEDSETAAAVEDLGTCNADSAV